MEKYSYISYLCKKCRLTIILAILLFNPLTLCAESACIKDNGYEAIKLDTTISAEIKKLLNSNLHLSFTNSVRRLYIANSFQPIWITPSKDHQKTWEAMLMIDCVLQFGLSHDDYHPTELLYDRLHQIFEKPRSISNQSKARFEIMLTDALLAFTNHLHYGKLNPAFTTDIIDHVRLPGMRAEMVLLKALTEKDFMSAIVEVQPKCIEYAELGEWMRLVKGQYIGDCYEVPEPEVRKVAINMERLRWAGFEDSAYLHLNIPSFALKLRHPDTTYEFKAAVGKVGSPTPALSTSIGEFIIAPDHRLPDAVFQKIVLPAILKDSSYLQSNYLAVYRADGSYVPYNKTVFKQIRRNPQDYFVTESANCQTALGKVAFNFPNSYGIYIHDEPDSLIFNKAVKAINAEGCISINHGVILAGLLLYNDGQAMQIPAMQKAATLYHTTRFRLKKPIPFKITYLTAEIVNGFLVTYPDVYRQDTQLEMALYNVKESFTKR